MQLEEVFYFQIKKLVTKSDNSTSTKHENYCSEVIYFDVIRCINHRPPPLLNRYRADASRLVVKYYN